LNAKEVPWFKWRRGFNRELTDLKISLKKKAYESMPSKSFLSVLAAKKIPPEKTRGITNIFFSSGEGPKYVRFVPAI
jgi:hypothetical protein